MRTIPLLTAVALTLFAFTGVSEAGSNYVRRPGYQQYHYAPHSYRGRDRVIYRHGYSGPSRGYYRYGNRHYGQRTLYFNFFGFPVVTY
jgi:hypothetical protein